MRKTKWLLFSGISGILTLVCFIGGIIAYYNRPSRAEYELAKAFGDTARQDFARMLPNIMIIAGIVFLALAITMLVIGMVQKKSQKA